MSEFSNKNTLDVKINIIDKHSLPCNMMLGKEAWSDLKIKLDYEHDVVKRDKIRMLMKSKSEVYDLQQSQNCILYVHLCAMRMNRQKSKRRVNAQKTF